LKRKSAKIAKGRREEGPDFRIFGGIEEFLTTRGRSTKMGMDFCFCGLPELCG
jgi:hypothetical protein